MVGPRTKEQVVEGTRDLVKGWVTRRIKKFKDENHATMAVNPFLMPILHSLHSADSFEDLGTLLLTGHLMTGHSTGFGKLVDEHVLPKVFGTEKLTKMYRQQSGLKASYFDNIDHVVHIPGKKPTLLSLKASRWTIQLGQAVELNRSFSNLLTVEHDRFEEIVVGVFYGREESLGDKYRIVRGINTGANHQVVDLRDGVKVLAGRAFWSWLNGDEPATQEWVLEGIMEGVELSASQPTAREQMASYVRQFAGRYSQHVTDGQVDWAAILSEING